MRPTPLSQNDLSWDNTRPIQYNGGLSGRTSHTMLVSAAAGRALYPYRATMDTGKTERICCYGEDVHANKQHRCQRGDLGRAWVWWGVLTRSGATISWRPPVLRYIIHHILVNPAMMGIPVRMTLSDHPVPGSTTLRKKNGGKCLQKWGADWHNTMSACPQPREGRARLFPTSSQGQ